MIPQRALPSHGKQPVRNRLAAVLTTLALVLMTAVGTFVLPIATKTEAAAEAATETPGSASLTLGTIRGGMDTA